MEKFSIEGKTMEVVETNEATGVKTVAETPKFMDTGIVAERVRRLLKLAPGTVPKLEQLDQIPANQLWKVEEARLLAQARGERLFIAGTSSNRSQRRA